MTKGKKSYGDLLKEEILEIARRLGLTNLSKLRKEEIVDLVEKAETKSASRSSSRSPKPDARKATPVVTSVKAKVDPKPMAKSAAGKDKEKPSDKPAKPTPEKPSVTTKAGGQKKASVRKPSAERPVARPAPERPARKPETASTAKRPTPPRVGAPRPTPPRPAPLGPVSAQAGASASKYVIATSYEPEELRGVDETLPELPETYGDNRIVLLPRDLTWLFAYWDLSQEYKEAARSAGGSVLALRLYDVTGLDFDGTNAHAMVEHECAEWARSWYIPTPATDRDFVVEIGYRGADQWFPLARSNKVSVPSDQPSTWIKDDFITIRFNEDLREIRERLQPTSEPAAPGPRAAALRSQTLFDDGELRIVVGGALLPPSGVPQWPPSSGMLEALSLPSSGQLFQLPASAGSASFLAGSAGFVVPSSAALQLPSSGAFLLPTSGAFVPGSGFLLPSSPGFLHPPAGGGPGQLAIPGAAGATTTARDGQGAAAGAAGAGPQAPHVEPPILLASIEMVISGRTVPGTELRIAGRPIPMGPDGAFSLRVTVPEGMRELPIEARWVNATESRRIMLKLGRETE